MSRNRLAHASGVLALLAASAPAAASAQPVYHGEAHAATTLASSLASAAPVGTQAGDVLVAVVDARLGAKGKVTPPSGWALARLWQAATTPLLTQAVYTHAVTAADPASARFGFSGATQATLALMAYGGVDASAPVEATSVAHQTSASTATAPSLATTASQDVAISAFGSTTSSTATLSSGVVKRVDYSSGGSNAAELAAGDRGVDASGATGDTNATFGSPGKLVGMQIALRGAPAARAPGSTAPPAIRGAAQVGATLTSDTGVWSGSVPMSFTTTWQRCDAAGASCLPIVGATTSSYVPQLADAGATLRVVVSAQNGAGSGRATSPATAAVTTGPAPLFRDTFDAPNGTNNVITNEYAFWNAPGGVQSAAWEMDSGSAFSIAPPAGVGASGNVGWTGVPDTCGNVDQYSQRCTNSNIFRLDSRRRDFGDVSLSIDGYNRGYSVSSPDDWDGIELWLRYQDEYHLYLVKPERHDGHVTIQKKCPGGPSNSGTYYMLFEQSGHAFPFNAWLHLSASARTNADGSVTLTVSRDGQLIGQATDRGGSDIYGARETCGPITNAGGIGIRGDNDDFYFDNLEVDPLS